MSPHLQNDDLRPIPENGRANTSLIVLADIAPEEEAAFNEWYNREHMRDRVLPFPSFVRGRRYVAVGGSPKYLALYETTGAGVFTSEAYVSLVRQPDPRSQHFITRFENAYRTIARIDFAYGEGEGGALALWRLEPQGGKFGVDALHDAARRVLLLPGVVATQALSKDEGALAASSSQHVRQGNKTISRALLVEAMDLASVRNAATAVTGMLGNATPEPGFFQLLYRVSP